jgi:hypothetical protein
VEVDVAECNAASGAQAEVDGFQDSRFATIAWSDEAIDSICWEPFEAFQRAEAPYFDFPDSCHRKRC